MGCGLQGLFITVAVTDDVLALRGETDGRERLLHDRNQEVTPDKYGLPHCPLAALNYCNRIQNTLSTMNLDAQNVLEHMVAPRGSGVRNFFLPERRVKGMTTFPFDSRCIN